MVNSVESFAETKLFGVNYIILFQKLNHYVIHVADKIEDLTHRIFERIELSCTQAKAVNTMN